MVTTRDAVHAVATGKRKAGLKIGRHFTSAGVHPYDGIAWELRDAVITDWRTGAVAFEQRGVEFPSSWSMNATTIVAQKYFRGQLGTPERERSVRHMIDRVADTITGWGRADGYFADDDSAEAFNAELQHILVHQMAAFNSPVWFNVGVEERPQCSACQPYNALVSTPNGMVPIGEIVERNLVGLEVLDSSGTTKVRAVKHNGRKRVYRVALANGSFIEATADHVVRAVQHRRTEPQWLRIDELQPGMRLHLQPHRATVTQEEADPVAVSEAALAGWLQGDGFVGRYETGTNRSLTIEFLTANSDEYGWIKQHLDMVFPDAHRKVRPVDGLPEMRRIRLYGEHLRDFVERYGLLNRRHDIRVPAQLWTAPTAVVRAYLRSVLQAEGFVATTGGSTRVGWAVISEAWSEDVQLLLQRLGIYSRRYRKAEPREDRSDTWQIDISYLSERERFDDLVGFIGFDKQERLLDSLQKGGKRCPDLREEAILSIDDLGEQDVYDIQTDSEHYLSNNVVVHNCFILSVEDTMSSILNWYVEEGTIFKGGSGSGVNLSRIRSSKETLRGGGEASGPVSFMRGADASAGTIKSGGKTRRAAKMVMLDVDHPDIEEFIWCKSREELKARALREAGFDMDLDGKDSASVQYQNANNSVRVTDAFMHAVEAGADFALKAVTTGETLKTIEARDLLRQIATAAWECADPGVQYDTTINDWHTTPNAGRINGSNPCFTGDALVHTDKGLVRFDELLARVNRGETFGVYTHDETSPDEPAHRVELTTPEAFLITGRNPIVRLRLSNGMEVRCTPGHKIFTTNRGYVPAEELTAEDRVKILDLPTPAISADLGLPISSDVADYQTKGDRQRLVRLPEKWSDEFAHYLGWLVGDGSFSGNLVSTIYGTAEEQEHVLPAHRELTGWMNGDVAPTPSRQANGTVQLRQSRRVIRHFLEALGLSSGRAPEKQVPWSIREAPPEIVAAFLRGLFDADGTVHDGGKYRHVGLGSRSHDLVVDVQRLLSTFGIVSAIYANAASGQSGFTYKRKDGRTVSYESSGTAYDLRIAGRSMEEFAARIGFSLPSKSQRLDSALAEHVRYQTDETVRLVERTEDGVELTYNLSEPRNHSYVVNGVVVRNCSEYMHLDNSACNLASLNLRKFEAGGVFDVVAFRRAVEIVFTAQEIIVGNSSYPTERIEANAHAYRQLGLGYANLGSLLMSQGLAYDSDEGRAWTSAITALMTGHAYRTSAEIAKVRGPFAGFEQDRDGMLRVLGKHRDALGGVDRTLAPVNILDAAAESWDEAVTLAADHGVRNAQATVLAPTGTIAFLMDCDTTGIEPDLGLVKSKKLVGGGSMRIVNQTVPFGLQRLGYPQEQIEAIVAYIDEHATIEGAPAFRPEHLPVFDCAMGTRSISPMGHIRMMAAAQPWISGAISKCVVGDTLLSTADGLVRIDSLHRGEAADSFRDEVLEVASLGGTQKTDAFYFGGRRNVRRVRLRSGHTVTGTENHRLFVVGEDGPSWRYLDEIAPGEYVAVQYGAELWSALPATFDDHRPIAPHGSQISVTLPSQMTDELAFLLGAFVSEGHINRSNWTVVITNSVREVLERVRTAWRQEFGVEAKIVEQPGKCPGVVLASKTVVEFLDYLGCGTRASEKRIPDAVLRSPRAMVLSFLRGLHLDAYAAVTGMKKLALCVDSPALLDDYQAILTNLGIVHGRIRKYNREYDKTYDEVYATGEHAGRLAQLVPFLEPEKAARAQRLPLTGSPHSTSDVVPGVTGRELYDLVPSGVYPGGLSKSVYWRFLLDARTVHVSRLTLARVAETKGVELPAWLQSVLDDGLHFSPVETVEDAGERDVYDVSVPTTHAFVGNGIVNHNTVNLPESATIEDVEDTFVEGWKLGLKAIAIYRDNCKVAQPLSLARKDAPAATVEEAALEHGMVRRRLPKQRPSQTISFQVGDAEGYLTAGEYPGDGLGEIFVKLGKQGSTLSGVMDALAISVSVGLQYGVPLETYVKKFTNMRFEPAGLTDDPEVRFASSLVDYIFRRLAIEYLPSAKRQELGIYTMDERNASLDAGHPAAQAPQPDRPLADATGQTVLPVHQPIPVDDLYGDAPMCYTCGVKMQRAGSCHVCTSCGTTSGCS